MEGPSDTDDVCRNCGERLHPSDNFCQYCGERVEQTEPTSPERSSPGMQGRPAPGGRNVPEQGTGRTAPELEETPTEKSGRSPPGAPGIMRGKESMLKTLGVAVALVVAAMVVPLVGLGILAVVLFAIGLPTTPVVGVLVLLQFAWFTVLGIWYLRYRGYDWENLKAYLGVGMPSLKDYALIIITWIVMIVGAVIVATVLTEVLPELLGIEDTEPAENQINEIIEQNPEIVLIAIAFMFLVVGPAEEILFRGVVQNRIRERFSMVPGIVIASFLFASVHVLALASTDPIAIAMTITILFVTSLGLGWIYEYTGNIVVPILLHGFHNSVIVSITALGAMYDLEPEEAVLLIPEWISALPLPL